MIRKFRAETEDAKQRVFTTKAKTLDGIVRAARKATGDARLDASCISPAWRPGWHPLSNPYVRKALGIEGQAGLMYIEYVTVSVNKVLHQLREVGTMASAVKRLEATGFTRTGRMGNLEWSDGYTDAHIHFGSLDDARASIARYIHEYSFLD